MHGCALAYFLTLRGCKPTVIECAGVASAASGKGGGFLARDWGSGSTTQLHHVSFALHEEIAGALSVSSYRRIPVLSVEPGHRNKRTQRSGCDWLDGDFDNSQVMDQDGGAQVDPAELCHKLMEAALAQGAIMVQGTVEGVETATVEGLDGEPLQAVSGVRVDGQVIPATDFVVTMGPWSVLAQEWFGVPIPITGIKSTSIVFTGTEVEPFALFCGEDDRFNTHLEVYPRTSGSVYVCGVGGSEHVSPDRLRAGEYPPSDVPADPARAEAAAASIGTMSSTFRGRTPDIVQACMRPCPPDGLPLMGKISHLRGAYISAGHNCWGILWAPVSGKAMSEVVLDGAASCVDLAPFSPMRFVPKSASKLRSSRGRKQGTRAVGEQW